MKECAFCSHQGKLSNEHIVSQWLKGLFPGRITSIIGDGRGLKKPFTSESIDWKAKVVCEACNNNWMSDIESHHAKPILTPLVTGKMDIPIDQAAAHSLALFVFKTAVILDHSNRSREPFFSRRIRHAFRIHRLIPSDVNMWMCGYAGHRAGVHAITLYHQAESTTGYRFDMYACTCAFGNFVFQMLAVKQLRALQLRTLSSAPKNVSIPFWPKIRDGFVWPPRLALMNRSDFNAFAARWGQDIELIGE